MESILLIVLALLTAGLVAALLVQRAAARRSRSQLEELAGQLSRILDSDSGERVMVFTQDPALRQLAGQLNRALDSRQALRAEARRTEQAFHRMLSNLSHDIRTPMTVLLGYLELIQRTGTADEATLDKVDRKARQVNDLIDQTFTLAKLEADDTPMTCTRLSLNELCRTCLLDFYQLLTQQGFQVELHIPETPIFARADQEALGRILSNLLSNAIRYGGEGAYLGLTLREEPGEVCIDVTDHGQGIPAPWAEQVFDRRFTVPDAQRPFSQGSGLGLAIARALARGMGGDLTLDSQPHVCTVFTLHLSK